MFNMFLSIWYFSFLYRLNSLSRGILGKGSFLLLWKLSTILILFLFFLHDNTVFFTKKCALASFHTLRYLFTQLIFSNFQLNLSYVKTLNKSVKMEKLSNKVRHVCALENYRKNQTFPKYRFSSLRYIIVINFPEHRIWI